MKVRFIQDAAGYSVNDVADFPREKALSYQQAGAVEIIAIKIYPDDVVIAPSLQNQTRTLTQEEVDRLG